MAIESKLKHARRRQQSARIKRKFFNKIRSQIKHGAQFLDPDSAVGILTNSHGAVCSCYMCGNPRKFFGEKSIQEKKFDQKELHQEES